MEYLPWKYDSLRTNERLTKKEIETTMSSSFLAESSWLFPEKKE
jgi:hypothetical protein